jgi:hypothetical protein
MPMARYSQRHWKRLGCAGIAVAAGVTVGLSVHHEVQLTAALVNPGQIAGQTASYRQQQCIFLAIRSEVPKGATAYITSQYALPPTERLSELSTPWVVLTDNPAAARWTLSLVSAPGHCGGLELEVHRL